MEGLRTIVVLNVFFVVLLRQNYANGDLVSILDRCCQVGRQWYTHSNERCSSYPNSVLGVAQSEQMDCQAIIQVCCLDKRKTTHCEQGKSTAKVRRSCDALRSQLGNEDASECCNCCKLGLVARSAGLSCSLLETYSPQCNAAFHECCSGSRSATPFPTYNPPTTTTASTTTTTETAASTEMNLCTQFSGQLCAQVCIPTPRSYRCECNPGYTLHTDGRTCMLGAGQNLCGTSHPCEHICEDTGFAISCKCFTGFVLNSDGQTCSDIDECQQTVGLCGPSQVCTNTIGSYACEGSSGLSCPEGFTYSTLRDRCEDIDECAMGRHNCGLGFDCVNSEGSFRCIPILDPNYGGDSEEEYTSADGNGNEIDNGFNCGTGFQFNSGLHRCQDIDECHLGQHRCVKDHQICHNTIGSYTCMCDTGFQYNPRTFACEDVNECALSVDTCTQGQTCENTIGSYNCRRVVSCGTGYTLDRLTQSCIDDDECALGTHNCGPARQCRNIKGSFRCVIKDCDEGYVLDYRTGECTRVYCGRGLKPDRGGNCIDINECVERSAACLPNQRCQNTIGSYVCRNLLNCGPGYRLNSDGTTCVDIDECLEGGHNCVGPLMECINSNGTYMCQCPEGYQMNHSLRKCEDINECERHGSNLCALNAICENNEGSFRCVCKDGFEKDEDGVMCRDIDECATPGICQHGCRNTWGSFQCTCYDGYKPSANGRTCEDIDECDVWSQRGGQLCVGLCQNTRGSYVCSCPDGYTMMSDERTCQDIDECALGSANCDDDDTCVNTRGGYKCQPVTCPSGFVKTKSVNRRSSNVKCQRQSFVCPQGDIDCLYAPLSYTTNFITFPSRIRIPADLFTMRGPPSRYRRMDFDLKLVSARDPFTGDARVSRSFFNVNKLMDNEAVVQLLREIEGPQDIELQLDMNIYSKEFRQDGEEIFFGTAVAKIYIYVTKEAW